MSIASRARQRTDIPYKKGNTGGKHAWKRKVWLPMHSMTGNFFKLPKSGVVYRPDANGWKKIVLDKKPVNDTVSGA